MDNNIKRYSMNVIKALGDCLSDTEVYADEKRDILDKYRDRVLEAELQANEDSFRAKATTHINIALGNVAELRKVVENGSKFDGSLPIHEAAELLKAKDIPMHVLREVAAGFNGNKVALSLVMATARDEYKDYFSNLIYDYEEAFDELEKHVKELHLLAPEGFPLTISAIKKDLCDIAVKEGFEIYDDPEYQKLSERNVIAIANILR